ncbi:hypothetical protein DSECCO2_647380 [anaerobic digester metagenome]
MTIFGLAKRKPASTLRMKKAIIARVTSKSAMTPSFMGRMARMRSGVRPRNSLASVPTAMSSPLRVSMATTEGSLSTMPSVGV